MHPTHHDQNWNFDAKFSHMTFFNFIQNVGKQHVRGFAIDILRFGIQDESKETRRLVIHSFFLNYFFVFALNITSAFEYSAPLACSHINLQLQVAVLQRKLCRLLMDKNVRLNLINSSFEISSSYCTM